MRMFRNMLVSILAFAAIVAAQIHTGGLTTDPGALVDFSASTVTTPTSVGTSLPGTCNVGQQFFKSNNSAGTELYLCTSTNTWTQATSGAGGGMADPGANGVMKRTALNTTAAATATDVSALNYVAGSGTAQAQVATLATPITSLTNGVNICWLPAAANTGAAPTLAVNGLAAKPLTKYGTAALVANDLTTTAIACAVYDGTQFELQNPQTLPVFVKINGGAAVGPQTTLNLIPGTGLAGFTGVVNGSQIDVTLPIDTAYLKTFFAQTSNAGMTTIAAGATTVVVSNVNVTANSEILITFDASLGTKLSVTCNATYAAPYVSARTAGVSFTIATPSAPSVNPACYSWSFVN